MIKILAPIKPVTWPRPRFDSRSKNTYNTKLYNDYKDALGYYALQAMRGRPPLTGEVKLAADFYKPRPQRSKHVSFIGDVDRYLNAVLDALIGICYVDDRQVTDIHGRKIFGDPHINIELEEI